MLPKNISFVDIETTGVSVTYGRIIEIGILRVEDNRLIRKYKTLINPKTYLDPFIENLTGIKSSDLENAPTFSDLKNEILELLIDSVFVAHNVRFDYGFIRNEFKRLDINYSSKHFCTVKLAKFLYPKLRKYDLDSIIERFNIKCVNRHRAYDDAKVLWEFYKRGFLEIDNKKFTHAVDLALKRPTVPVDIPEIFLESLPETFGVYVFYGKSSVPLYIGKSINIKDRVLSHFSNDSFSSLDMRITQQVKRIETFVTTGELGALFLESSLIKNLQPLFNRKLRHAKKLILLKKKVLKGFNTIAIERANEIGAGELEDVVNVYKSFKELKDLLYSLCKDYSLCLKLMGLQKSKGPCFYYHLSRCKGACVGKENILSYNLRFDEALYKYKIKSWPFKGPIVIDGFIIDKWCVLGNVTSDKDLFEFSKKYLFDVDTHKILIGYLNNLKNFKKIKVLASFS